MYLKYLGRRLSRAHLAVTTGVTKIEMPQHSKLSRLIIFVAQDLGAKFILAAKTIMGPVGNIKTIGFTLMFLVNTSQCNYNSPPLKPGFRYWTSGLDRCSSDDCATKRPGSLLR